MRIQRITILAGFITLLGWPGAAVSQVPGVQHCTGGGGGTAPLTDHASLVFSVGFEGDEAVIGALVVVRHDQQREATQPVRWPPPPFPSSGGGGNIDSLLIVYDGAGRVWLHERPVELSDANVLLVDRNAAGAPSVVAKIRVTPRVAVPGSPCAAPETRALTAALRAHVLAVPEIAAFTSQPEGTPVRPPGGAASTRPEAR